MVIFGLHVQVGWTWNCGSWLGNDDDHIDATSSFVRRKRWQPRPFRFLPRTIVGLGVRSKDLMLRSFLAPVQEQRQVTWPPPKADRSDAPWPAAARRACIALRVGHPALAGFDLDRWLDFPHILVSGKGDAHSPMDAELARLGRTRRIELFVPSFGMVPPLLRGSDMVAMLPSRILADTPDLVGRPVPIPVPGFALHLGWHRRRTKDSALQHVAAC